MLEGERQLGGRALERADPRRQLRLAVRGDEAADPLELLVGDGRVAGADELGEIVRHGRRAQVDLLEQRVHRVADLGRREAGLPGNGPGRVGWPQADHPLGEVAVRAALEQRERAVREPAHAVQRRRGHLGERRELRCLGRGRAVLQRPRTARAASRSAGSGRHLGLAARTGRAGRARARRRARSPAARPRPPRARPPRAGRAPSRSACLRPPHARRSRPRRSAGRSRASSRRSRAAAARPPPRPARPP